MEELPKILILSIGKISMFTKKENLNLSLSSRGSRDLSMSSSEFNISFLLNLLQKLSQENKNFKFTVDFNIYLIQYNQNADELCSSVKILKITDYVKLINFIFVSEVRFLDPFHHSFIYKLITMVTGPGML